MFLSNKTKIRFLHGNFSSPILGNVWAGRIATLPKKTAQQFIDLKYAELFEENVDARPAKEKPLDDGDNRESNIDREGASKDADKAAEPPAEKPLKSKDKKHGRGHKSK